MRYDQQTTTTGLLTTWERPPKPCGSIVAVTPLPCTRLQDSMIRVRTQYLQNFNSSAHASIRAENKFSRSWKSTVNRWLENAIIATAHVHALVDGRGKLFPILFALSELQDSKFVLYGLCSLFLVTCIGSKYKSCHGHELLGLWSYIYHMQNVECKLWL